MTVFERGVFQESVESPQPIFQFNDSALGSAFDVVKGSAGTLFWIQIDASLSPDPIFIQLFDNATPTVGSTSADEIISCAAGATVAVPKMVGVFVTAGFDFVQAPGSSITVASYVTGGSPGKSFSNAITVCCTKSLTGVVGPSGSVSVTISYQ